MAELDMAEHIYFNCDIITMDEAHEANEKLPWADGEHPSAVAVDESGTILAVGKLEKVVKDWKKDGTSMVSLEGKTLMPGFIEPHSHAVAFMLFKNWFDGFVDGMSCKSYEDVKKVINDVVKDKEVGEQTFFFGWDAELIPDLPVLDKTVIDDNFTKDKDVGIVILGQSGHVGWANDKAFEIADVTYENTEDLIGGSFDHYTDEDGKEILTGQFFEPAAFERMCKNSVLSVEVGLPDVLTMYTDAGFTTTTDISYPAKETLNDMIKEVYKGFEQEGNQPIRLAVYEDAHEKLGTGDSPATCCPKLSFNNKKGEDAINWPPNEYYWKAGVKVIADGSPHSGSMAVREPFLKSNLTETLGFPEAPCYGKLNYSAKSLNDFVEGFYTLPSEEQIAIHCHGERACEQVLCAYEKVLSKEPGNDRRYRMEHVGLVTEDQVERASKINLGLSFFVNHLYHYGKTFNNYIFGPERTNRWAPCSLGTKHGVRWTLHQDHPAFPGTPAPFMSIQTAVTRTANSHPETVYGPEYCVSVYEALKAYTINAAWQVRKDNSIGSLTPGKFADLLVLDENPFKVDPFRLEHIKVFTTVLNGHPVNSNFVPNGDGNNIYVLKKD